MKDDLISRKEAIIAASNAVDEWDGGPNERRYDMIASAINAQPPAQPTLYGYNIKHLAMIAMVLQKEDLPPERVAEALNNIGRIVAVVKNEFEEALRKAVEE